MTALNRKILELVQSSHTHMNAEEVFLLAKENGIKVSVASVYRILGKLAAEGCIRQLTDPGHPDVFDRNLCEHGHMICSSCGSISDLFVPGLGEKLEAISGAKIDGYELTVSWICPDCRAKKEQVAKEQEKGEKNG